MLISESAPPEPTDLNILVFGSTGVGKSTIINLLTDYSDNLLVGDSLESCTETIEVASIIYKDRKMNFFDTPGFDDSRVSATDHLRSLSLTLSAVYDIEEKRKPHIHGVLYVHRITDNKIARSSMTNLQVVRNLLGEDLLKNLVFVTNMWSNPPEPQQVKREEALMGSEKYFGGFIKAGARAGPAYRIAKNATCFQAQRAILDLFLESGPQVARIQRELVDGEMTIEDTAAGRVVNEELEHLRNKKEREIRLLRAALEDQRDSNGATLAALGGAEDELHTLRAELERIETQMHALQSQYNKETLEEEIRRQQAKRGRSHLVKIAGTAAGLLTVVIGVVVTAMKDPSVAMTAATTLLRSVLGG